MKNRLMLGLVAIAVLSLGFKSLQTSDPSLGKAQKIQGKYVFVMCEPVQDYEFLTSKNSNFRNQLMGGSRTTLRQMQMMVKKGNKMVEDGEMGDFDGVISADGVETSFIRFIE